MQGCKWSEVLCPSGAILPIMDGKGLFYLLRHILGPSQMQAPPPGQEPFRLTLPTKTLAPDFHRSP